MWSWVGNASATTWDVEAVPDQYGGTNTTQAAVLSWAISDTSSWGTGFSSGDSISYSPGAGNALSDMTFSIDFAVTNAAGTQPVTIWFDQFPCGTKTFDASFTPVLVTDGSWNHVTFTLDQLVNNPSGGAYDSSVPFVISVAGGGAYVIGTYTVKMDNLKLFAYAYSKHWPYLVPISDYVTIAGTVISLQVSAMDTDSPPHQLTFSLGPDAPPGATISPINLTNALFTWPTTSADAETFHSITVMVTADGIPPRSDTNTFTIVLLGVSKIEIVDFALSGTNFVFSWSAVPGLDCHVQYASSLTGPWTDLPGDVLVTNTIATIVDDTIPTSVTSRFYRVITGSSVNDTISTSATSRFYRVSTGSSMNMHAIGNPRMFLQNYPGDYPGPGITVDKAPAASDSTVTVNDPIPLIVSASDMDQQSENYIFRGENNFCIGRDQLGISSRLIDLADPVNYRWVLYSGGGSLAAVDCPATLYTPPNLNIGEKDIAIVQAIITDSRGNDVPATVTCRIEITRLDEGSYQRIITVQTNTTPGERIDIPPSECDCAPLAEWQAEPDALTAEVQSPVVVGVGQRVRLQASGADSDTLFLAAYDGPCGHHPETTAKLPDELTYTWSAAQGSFPDYDGPPVSNGRQTSVIYKAPDTPGDYTVTVTIRDSGKQGVDAQIVKTIQVKAVKVDLDIDGLSETDEDSVGGLVVRNYDANNVPRKKITIQKVDPNTWSGNVTLTKNSTKAKVFTASTGGSEVTFNGTDNKFANSALPRDLYVQGDEQSDSMRDVQIKAEAEGVSGCADLVSFTVLWVDEPTVSVSGSVSSDNDKRDAYKGWTVANTYKLGLQLYNANFVERMGWGTEAKGVVHPAAFNYPGNNLKLERDNEYHDWIGNGSSTIGSRSFNATIPPGNDTGPAAARDDNPSPNGNIYDWDAAGLLIPTAPQNQIRRTRNNFKAFASITVDGNAVRCSPVRNYFIRFSMKQVDSPSGTNWVAVDPPDVTDDKQAGNGTTKLTWDLQ